MTEFIMHEAIWVQILAWNLLSIEMGRVQVLGCIDKPCKVSYFYQLFNFQFKSTRDAAQIAPFVFQTSRLIFRKDLILLFRPI